MCIQVTRYMMQNDMKIIGITGGIGSGKSVCLSILEKDFGAYIVQADQVAHLLMEPGEDTFDRIVGTFGDGILNDGRIDRGKLGAIVMSDETKLGQLNSIVHPAVKDYILQDIENRRDDGVRIYVLEAALLIQDGYKQICDEIWFIHTDKDIRVRRLREGRGYSEEKAISFMNNQPDDDFFMGNCDRVINNNSDADAMKILLDHELQRLFAC